MADDAWEKITAGASLLEIYIEIYPGWIYESPGIVRRICEELLDKLAARNLTSLSEAIRIAN